LCGRWFPAWGAAIELGDVAGKTVKGHDLAYDLNLLAEVRQQTLAEFPKRDDNWLMAVDKTWGRGSDEQTAASGFTSRVHKSNHAEWADQIPGEAIARCGAEQRIGTLIAKLWGWCPRLSKPLLSYRGFSRGTLA
jgi:hypothetical protein